MLDRGKGCEMMLEKRVGVVVEDLLPKKVREKLFEEV